MNRDQTAIADALHVQGWHMLKQNRSAVMALSGSGKVAIIRPNRSIEILKDGGKVEHFCYVQAYKGRGWCDLAVSIATAAAKTKLTSEQFGAVLHAIGGGDGRFTRPGWRNFYESDGVRYYPSELVSGGYMAHGKRIFTYRVTPKGAAEVGCAGCLDKQEPA